MQAAVPAARIFGMRQAFVTVHESAASVVSQLFIMYRDCCGSLPLTGDVDEQVQQLLEHPAAALLLLQSLAACTALMHGRHLAHKQAQQRQQRQRQQQHRADLLPIPAFHQHQDMLQLLPGGQAWLDAAGRATVHHSSSQAINVHALLGHAGRCSYALSNSIMFSFATAADMQQFAPVLSAAAVRLVLELQLLAAAEHQQWKQQQLLLQQVDESADSVAFGAMLSSSTRLLHTLIRAVAQASGSCLPPEVLQQAGLQLLQALAAPLQQLQLYGQSALSIWDEKQHIGEACHTLVTAACGPASEGVVGEVAEYHPISC
jgi:hypothetical protein